MAVPSTFDANRMLIPGGLSTSFTEDGKVEASGKIQRFGHRDADPVNKKTNALRSEKLDVNAHRVTLRLNMSLY